MLLSVPLPVADTPLEPVGGHLRSAVADVHQHGRHSGHRRGWRFRLIGFEELEHMGWQPVRATTQDDGSVIVTIHVRGLGVGNVLPSAVAGG